MASSILAAKDEWAQIQCIPDIRAGCEPLIKEMKKEYPQVDSLSDIHIGDMPNIVVSDVTVNDQEQSVINVEGLKAMEGEINGIASSRNGNIVISGKVGLEMWYSHITVIDRKGQIQRQDLIKKEKVNIFLFKYRFCCYLSDFKVATVCEPYEIGIYDVRDGSYNRKYIRDVIRRCSVDRFRCVSCVSYDPLTKQIIVGTGSRFVYVFDDQLNYIRTITLPDVIIGVYDITVNAGTLLVCDYGGESAYAVTMEGSESKLMYEFTKPDLTGSNIRPLGVCTDKNGFIYMLWRENLPESSIRRTLVRYSQNGRQLLTTRTVKEDANCLASLEMGGSEKILIAGITSGNIYEFDTTEG